MTLPRKIGWIASCSLTRVIWIAASTAAIQAHGAGAQTLQFQKPSTVRSASQQQEPARQFRAPSTDSKQSAAQSNQSDSAVVRATYEKTLAQKNAQRKTAQKSQPTFIRSAKTPGRKRSAQASTARAKVRRRSAANYARASYVEEIEQPGPPIGEYYVGDDPCCDDPSCEAPCGVPDYYEAGCGVVEPVCGCVGPCECSEPSCEIVEMGCGFAEPSCGACGVPGCGSCVLNEGPDYWCFPVCLPRFKDFKAWAGVQGFRGPRDFSGGESDSNFGFHEGFNLTGRAPLIGLFFPELSYQLGYQAVQSRLSGTATSNSDRSQQFVTGGFFRRVHTGLQFGLVWDMLSDDLDSTVDYHQIRSEVSIKTPRGREIGFFSTIHTNDVMMAGTTYQSVDQFAGFYRWQFRGGIEGRLWAGVTNDNEGLFGGDFSAPISECCSLETGFNYLITDQPAGLAGVREEAWNIGISLVWHAKQRARVSRMSLFRPLFGVANNGWIIVDEK